VKLVDVTRIVFFVVMVEENVEKMMEEMVALGRG